ncbi:hypothetical protein HKW73_31235 [Pseudomonas aeruginosa]|nr:hypothetical protein [Pseudomonas aeruginosa]MBF3305763.1 hypothetical protein [Pseudomonas aeruginosa]
MAWAKSLLGVTGGERRKFSFFYRRLGLREAAPGGCRRDDGRNGLPNARLGRGFLANCKYQFAALFFNLLIYKKLIFKKNWYAFCSKGMRLITGVKESDETGGQQC